MKDLFTVREEEIFKTLRELEDCDFVIIGGYAVNAYTLPRFSVDCDIVIKDQNELKNIEKILLKQGYIKEHMPEEAQYSGYFSRYEKKVENNFRVSIDILIRQVTDRMTGVTFTVEWIFENSAMRILKGKTITEMLKLRIITIDALLVMKIIACRSTDIRDVFMMMPYAQDKEWVASEIKQRYDLKDRLSNIIEKVTAKQFKDGLSGIYGRVDPRVFEKHKKALLTL
ncbi:nucleotidyl transferase AbiEii/AbiGii toxin family protein [Candidatus Woesearchaeota archaeon]|nr:nucleotidyl transferase AbiEii/AbiGii toxin family protein [Candidatus Woesearchaeota archaeon]